MNGPLPMSERSLASKPFRVREIDALRGLAAVAVLLFHYTKIYDYHHGLSPGPFSFSVGYYGVHLFFVISGFVILLTLRNCRQGMDFVVSRFSRLFPSYWSAVLITFLVVFFFSEKRDSWTQLIANFTMLQRFLGFNHIDTVYWTLNVELVFYVWMFFLFRFNQLSRIIWIVPVALVLQDVLSFCQIFSGKYFSQGIKVVLLTEYLHLFCAGMLFYEVRENGWNRIRALLLGWCLVNQLVVPFRDFNWMLPPVWGGMAVFLIFAVMSLVVSGKLGFLVWRPLLFLGAISYPLYLLHNQIGAVLMDNMAQHGWARVPSFCGAVLVSLLLAILLHYGIEDPALRGIRARYRALKQGG